MRITRLLLPMFLAACGPGPTQTEAPPMSHQPVTLDAGVDAGTPVMTDAGAPPAVDGGTETPDAGVLDEPFTDFGAGVKARELQLRSCSSDYCHGPKFFADAKKHTSGVSGLPLVLRFQPEKSYLWHKVKGTHTTLPECTGGRCGDQMPKGAPLSAEDLEVIRWWIASGAE